MITDARAPFAVAARWLSKTFGNLTALEGLDLQVPTGSVFGYSGPNGAGKSTTIRLLLGLLRPTDADMDAAACSYSERRERTSRDSR